MNSYEKLCWVGYRDREPMAFLDHLFGKIDQHIGRWGRVLILTLTKKSSEEITNFLLSKGYKALYLHSEIDTLKRWDILKNLRNGTVDILIGINLLREWIDLPEVSLIAILDADKEWFLRSKTSLIQIIWRAARHPRGEVILYADQFTWSIVESIHETQRRRHIQEIYNHQHGIEPTQAISNIKNLETVKSDDSLKQDFASLVTHHTTKKLKRMTAKEKKLIHDDLKKQLDEAVKTRDFERAMMIRDQIKALVGEDDA